MSGSGKGGKGAGKGGKGGKAPTSKKAPQSRSSRAGLQVQPKRMEQFKILMTESMERCEMRRFLLIIYLFFLLPVPRRAYSQVLEAACIIQPACRSDGRGLRRSDPGVLDG